MAHSHRKASKFSVRNSGGHRSYDQYLRQINKVEVPESRRAFLHQIRWCAGQGPWRRHSFRATETSRVRTYTDRWSGFSWFRCRSDVAALFEPSIQTIIDAIDLQRQTAYKSISVCSFPHDSKRAYHDQFYSQFSLWEASLLVIGFSRDCKPTYHRQGSTSVVQTVMCTPNSGRKDHLPDLLRSNKAVADGAISFYLDHRVSARVAKRTYGLECNILYDPEDPQHRSRFRVAFTQASGFRYIPQKFSAILKKVRAH
jgi:hypothetical protein